jgi:glyoxalase family protein
MTEKIISGLHHVTALSSDAQKNLEFYAGVLGLRMVKKTVNFDAPDVYHLYYGDYGGSPGTLMTFFPYPGVSAGRKGTRQVTVTSFSVPADSLGYWMKRLERFNIIYTRPEKRFDSEEFIYFEDNDGLGIELVANDLDYRKDLLDGLVTSKFAIKGFFGVTLSLPDHENTAGLLTGYLDHKLIAEKNGRYRFSPSGLPGGMTDIVVQPAGQPGTSGGGTVHHIAFATENSDSQLKVRRRLLGADVHVTQVIDRQYFESIYFREPGGILFEVATLPPGMAVDEDIKHLGEDLKLPPWHESNRSLIEEKLGYISLDTDKFRD